MLEEITMVKKDQSSKGMRVKFNTSTNTYSKIKFNKTNNTFKPKAEVTPVEEDIYYDEIVYYDGGDVRGYGDN